LISFKPSRHTNKVFPSPLAKAAATPTPTVSPAPKTSTSLLRPHTRPATTHFPFPAGHKTAHQPRPHPPCTQPLSQDSLHSPSLSLHLHLPRSSSLSQNPSRPSPTDFSFFVSIVDHNRSSLIGTDRPPSISFTVSCSSAVLTGDPQASRTTAASPTAAATNRRADYQRLDHPRSSLYNRQIGRRKKKEQQTRAEKQTREQIRKGKRKLKSTACCVSSFAGNGGCHRRR